MGPSPRTASAIAALAVAASGLTMAAPATAYGSDGTAARETRAVVEEGRCSRGSDWKLRLSPSDQRHLQITFTIRGGGQSRPGAWKALITHNGEAVHHSVTAVPFGDSFAIAYSATVRDGQRTDYVTARAENQVNGEVCFGRARSDF